MPSEWDRSELVAHHWTDACASILVVGVQELRVGDRLKWEELLVREFAVKQKFGLVGKAYLMNMGIFVFLGLEMMKKCSVFVDVEWLGTGWFKVFGNKGCVGIRLGLQVDDRMHGFVFLNCHLTPHKELGYLRRRFESIQEMHAEMEILSDAENMSVFLFGDLNYRVVENERMRKAEIYENIRDGNWSNVLKLCDQLNVEQEYSPLFRKIRNVIYEEVSIPDFPPTYKYHVSPSSSKKRNSNFSEKHIPSWTDRILTNCLENVHFYSYQSVMDVVSSDHKPISLTVELDHLQLKNWIHRFPTKKMSNYVNRDIRRAFSNNSSLLAALIIFLVFSWGLKYLFFK